MARSGCISAWPEASRIHASCPWYGMPVLKCFASEQTSDWMTQAEQALASDEVPVGCVFVHKDQIIGRGMNDTNRSLNVCSITNNGIQQLSWNAIAWIIACICYSKESHRGPGTLNFWPSTPYSTIIHPPFFVKRVFMLLWNPALCVLQLSANFTSKPCITVAPTIVSAVLVAFFQSTPSMCNIIQNYAHCW